MPPSDDENCLFDLGPYTPKPDAQTGGEDEDDFQPEFPILPEALGKEIYALASEVRKIEPWGELEEDDCFGIRHPESGDQLPLIPLFELKGDKGADDADADDWEIGSCRFPTAPQEPLPEPPREDLFAARLAPLEVRAGEQWECGISLQHVGRLPTLGAKVDAMVLATSNLDSAFLKELNEHGPGDAHLTPVYRAPSSACRYILRIDLLYADPPVWRQISMPIDASFFGLHLAVQQAMGWEDEHLYGFTLRKNHRTVASIDWDPGDDDRRPYPSRTKSLPELTTTLQEVVKSGHRKYSFILPLPTA